MIVCLAALVMTVWLAAALPVAQQVKTPGPRLGHSLVYDATRERIVLFDGYWPDSDRPTDAWTWTGDRWEARSDSGPPAAAMGGATFDAARGTIVIHGGANGRSTTRRTWTWGRTARSHDQPDPAARYHHAIAYDSARARVVLYGGVANNVWDTTTWEWDGARWTGRNLPSPGKRAAFRMVYDAARRQIVLFGGVSGADQSLLNDTWVLDAAGWRRIAADGPAPRRDYSMTYDAHAGVVLLYGGAANQTRHRDMWRWDGVRWTEIPLRAPNPGHRYVSAMAYDHARRRTVLYGGYACEREDACGVAADTWEWDGAVWTKR